MGAYIKGTLDGAGLRIGIVVSRWNREITDGLYHGARRALIVAGVSEENILTLEVPGAFEMSVALEHLASSDELDALVALGCVIKGETAHFEHISHAAMEGIRDVSTRHQIPIACGLLTTYDIEQARERSGPDEENKGSEAALAAVEMATLFENLESSLDWDTLSVGLSD